MRALEAAAWFAVAMLFWHFFLSEAARFECREAYMDEEYQECQFDQCP